MRRLKQGLLFLLLILTITACGTPQVQSQADSAGGSVDVQIEAENGGNSSESESADLISEEVSSQPDVQETEDTGSVSTDQQANAEDTGQTIPENVDWKTMPVIPDISERAVAVYQRGLEMGNNPQSFSVLGECQSELAWEANGVTVQGYLSGFDEPSNYTLGEEYAYLQTTIEHFTPSWTQQRVAAHRGTNVAQVLSPLYSDQELCEPRESPLACEFRRNNPSIVLISFETWFYDRPISVYETYIRQIIELSIDEGVVPVLVTGAESHDRSQEINAILGKLAVEYEMPLWNFWRAVQDLPNDGLEPTPDENGFKHLTYGPNDFTDPDAMQTAWPVRNLTGLQTLHTIWQAGTQE